MNMFFILIYAFELTSIYMFTRFFRNSGMFDELDCKVIANTKLKFGMGN